MTAVDVTIIDQIISEGHKREIATRLTDALISLDRDRTPGERKRWRVVAQAMPSAALPERGTARRVADLDYPAWHAHLAGTRRWMPGRDGGTPS